MTSANLCKLRSKIVIAAVVFPCLMLWIFPARSGEPKTELLWPGGAPGAKGEEADDKPTLTICLAEKDKAAGSAVVVCPGGGYGFLAVGHEGVARFPHR